MVETTTEDRIQEQLDRLQEVNLSDKEIKAIEKKIEVLRSQAD